MRRTLKDLVIIYIGWGVFWWYIFDNYIGQYLIKYLELFLLIGIILIIKDVYDIKKKKGPWPAPKYFDHAPFSLMAAISFWPINQTISSIYILDFILDVYDDLKKLI